VAMHSGSAIPTQALDRRYDTPEPATVVQADELLGRMKRAQASTAGCPSIAGYYRGIFTPIHPAGSPSLA
jgi:hypothetical protein